MPCYPYNAARPHNGALRGQPSKGLFDSGKYQISWPVPEQGPVPERGWPVPVLPEPGQRGQLP